MAKVYVNGKLSLQQETEDKSGKTLSLSGLKETASEEGIVRLRNAFQAVTDLPYTKTLAVNTFEIQ